MNERAKALLDERFGAWADLGDGRWLRCPRAGWTPALAWVDGTARYELRPDESLRRAFIPVFSRCAGLDEAKAALDAALLRSVIEPVVVKRAPPWRPSVGKALERGDYAFVWPSTITSGWTWKAFSLIGNEPTEDAAKLAADFALYCEIVDAEKPKQLFTVTSNDDVDALEAAGKVSSAGAAAIRSALNQGLAVEPFGEAASTFKFGPKPAPMPSGVLFSEGFGSAPWPSRIPASFRAKLADEWELRPDGKHVRKATWEGMEFVAIEIVRSQKDGKIATFRCPGQAKRSTVIVPCGWSKKDRRYLSQLWALWSEHHQEVPGADWREVARARLGVK